MWSVRSNPLAKSAKKIRAHISLEACIEEHLTSNVGCEHTAEDQFCLPTGLDGLAKVMESWESAHSTKKNVAVATVCASSQF